MGAAIITGIFFVVGYIAENIIAILLTAIAGGILGLLVAEYVRNS